MRLGREILGGGAVVGGAARPAVVMVLGLEKRGRRMVRRRCVVRKEGARRWGFRDGLVRSVVDRAWEMGVVHGSRGQLKAMSARRTSGGGGDEEHDLSWRRICRAEIPRLAFWRVWVRCCFCIDGGRSGVC